MAGYVRAEVTLPKVLASHMVIQRDMPVHIWGWADAGETVEVTFRGEIRSTTADKAGSWEVYLSPRKAGGPFDLIVHGTNTINLSDILVGDLWVASGQSNMQMPMDGFPPHLTVNNAKKEIAAAQYPRIRLLQIAQTSSSYPLDDATLLSPWQACSPGTVRDFSAVGYFFARDLQATEKVPIGIIDSTWGGTYAAAWTSLTALTTHADLLPFLAEYADSMENRATVLRRAEKARASEQRSPAPFPARKGISWQPAGLYNAMIAPLTPLAIKGVIWYQGERDRYNNLAGLYGNLFPVLISDWRSAWGQGNFPFLYVQISSWSREAAPVGYASVIREAQRRTLAVSDTAMVVSADVGDPHTIHPGDKQAVGARLALAARALAYGEAVEYSGPSLRKVIREGDSLRIWFDHAKGLNAKGGRLLDFEVAGSNRRYVPAQAKIDGETVVVSSATIQAPRYVRYAWQPDPSMALRNAAGLPASPFTSDDQYENEN